LFTKLGYGLIPKFTQDYGLFRPPPPNRASVEFLPFCAYSLDPGLCLYPCGKYTSKSIVLVASTKSSISGKVGRLADEKKLRLP